jgi:hypothetical protein
VKTCHVVEVAPLLIEVQGAAQRVKNGAQNIISECEKLIASFQLEELKFSGKPDPLVDKRSGQKTCSADG